MKKIERTFINNLNERELRASGKNNLIVSDLHLAYMKIGYNCPFVGEKLKDSGLRSQYGISVATISRGSTVLPIPDGDTRLFPGDVIGVIGTDEQLSDLLSVVEAGEDEETSAPKEYKFTNIVLSSNSPLIGKTMVSAEINKNYSALVIAVKRDGIFLEPINEVEFMPHDILYIVGNPAIINKLK